MEIKIRKFLSRKNKEPYLHIYISDNKQKTESEKNDAFEDKDIVQDLIGLFVVFGVMFFFIGIVYYSHFFYLYKIDTLTLDIPKERYYFRAFELFHDSIVPNIIEDVQKIPDIVRKLIIFDDNIASDIIIIYKNIIRFTFFSFIVLTFWRLARSRNAEKIKHYRLYSSLLLIIFLIFSFISARQVAESRYSLPFRYESQFNRVSVSLKSEPDAYNNGCYLLIIKTEDSVYLLLDPAIIIRNDKLGKCQLSERTIKNISKLEKCKGDLFCEYIKQTVTVQIPIANIRSIHVLPEYHR
ncbi:MAG: hypothetical protein HW380_3522 [Magnetococcales bacterium]|nr:hypothetical protein [Magnetococcales bacterium]